MFRYVLCEVSFLRFLVFGLFGKVVSGGLVGLLVFFFRKKVLGRGFGLLSNVFYWVFGVFGRFIVVFRLLGYGFSIVVVREVLVLMGYRV